MTMKRNIIKKLGLLCITGMVMGCTADYDKLNTDPTGLTSGDPGYILPYIQEQGSRMGSWEYQVGDNLHTNLYAQYFANSAAYFNSGNYTFKSSWVTDGFWNSYYVGVLKQFKNVKEIATERPQYDNIYQVMRIFTARCTAQTTDIFGDIPYTEAAMGTSNAKYDSQKSIYADLFKELTEAVTNLNNHKDDPAQVKLGTTQDLVFQGNLSKWIRLGNSLRLRYAMRLTYVDAAIAKKEAEAALSAPGGLLTDNTDNACVYISGKGANGFPLFQISGWGEFAMSKTMENMLKQTSTVLDPRTALWFGHTKNSTAAAPKYQGVTNGLPSDKIPGDEERSYVWGFQYMPGWNSANNNESSFCIARPIKLMEYSEVCFLKAEAALRGYAGAGDAQQHYLDGIQASFDSERAGVDPKYYSASNDNTYKTTGSVAWSSESTAEGHLKQIMTQKWLALYPDGVEAWTEFRRTGYPSLTPVVQSMESTLPQGTFIKKLKYVDDETRDNPNAKNASLNNGKGDGMAIRVWWDTARYK